MKINTKFDIEQIVYLTTDEDQKKRVIVTIQIYPGNKIVYGVQCGEVFTWHYTFELTLEKDILMTSTN